MVFPQNPMVLWGEEEQGSERSFRREAETKMNGLCDDNAQGVQPLVRNAVTQNSPDLDGLGCSCLVGNAKHSLRTNTGFTPYRSAPLVPNGI